ncbi:MAG: MFS transporter, partial [Muribaculaceae bacterium]|nr:MFS transporter [Muribaculaceae bacterium]
MFFLFAMISFVTNLAAPIGTIWGNKFAGNSVLGMMGNMMNFLAYLFMGIPAGNMLVRMGYKKTALWAMAIGVVGLFIQWLSSRVGAEVMLTELVSLNFIIYLFGAFVCGFCVCMLNTVVNPMLNLLGGGGNKGNQLLQAGGALNSLSGTLTPFFVGALIGVLTKETTMSVVAPLLWIAMGVFVVAFFIILFVTIPEPNLQKSGAKKPAYTHSPWNFRHTVLGVIGIFFYVGIEVGIPGTLNFYLSDTGVDGAEVAGAASLVAGVIVAIYWFFMLVGRTVSSTISAKVSTKTQMIVSTSVAIVFIVVAIFTSRESKIEVPNFVYDPVQKTSQILVESDVPQDVIDNFVATKDAKLLSAHEATI